jgi:hypothetical protein
LRDTIAATPTGERPSYEKTVMVLYYLARWHRAGDKPVDETVAEIAEAMLLTRRTVSRCLSAITAAGLMHTTVRGGSRARRGSKRVLAYMGTDATSVARDTASNSCQSDGTSENGTRASSAVTRAKRVGTGATQVAHSARSSARISAVDDFVGRSEPDEIVEPSENEPPKRTMREILGVPHPPPCVCAECWGAMTGKVSHLPTAATP